MNTLHTRKDVTEENVFDFAEGLSSYVHYLDELRKKREQLSSVTKLRCGNCYHWMKTSCKPEKQFKQFKSSESFACGDFSQCPTSTILAERFTKELEDITFKYQGDRA